MWTARGEAIGKGTGDDKERNGWSEGLILRNGMVLSTIILHWKYHL